MTQALFDKLLRLDDQAVQWWAAYYGALQEASVAHDRLRAIEARIFTLLNLSDWVKGQW